MGRIIPGPIGGGLALVERVSVSGAAVASVEFSDLNGDVDRFYRLVYRVFKVSTLSEVEMRPNGLLTNQMSRRVTQESSTATFTTSVIAQPGAAGFEGGEVLIDALTGRVRTYWGTTSFQQTTPPTSVNQFIRSYAGSWNDIATNLVSLSLASDDGSSGIGIGSEFTLFKMPAS